MVQKKKNETTNEWFQRLQSDDEYKERSLKHDEELKNIRYRREKARKPIIKDIEALGIQFNSEWDFKIKSKTDAKVIPIILKHLDKDYEKFIKEGLYRCLRSPYAQDIAGRTLIEKFKTEDEELKWVIGHALEKAASENDIEDLITLLNDDNFNDEVKSGLTLALAMIMGKQAIPHLIKIVIEKKDSKETNSLVISSIEALGKLKAFEAKELVEFYTNHSDSWYRSQAKKALKKINSTKRIVSKLPKGIKYIKDNRFAAKYEASTEYDMEDVPEFLKLVCEKIDADPKALENLIIDTDVEETKTYELQVKQLLRTSKLYFQIFMDDIDTPGLYFFSDSKSLIKSIDKIIDGYVVD